MGVEDDCSYLKKARNANSKFHDALLENNKRGASYWSKEKVKYALEAFMTESVYMGVETKERGYGKIWIGYPSSRNRVHLPKKDLDAYIKANGYSDKVRRKLFRKVDEVWHPFLRKPRIKRRRKGPNKV